jgi:hypothetical protein
VIARPTSSPSRTSRVGRVLVASVVALVVLTAPAALAGVAPDALAASCASAASVRAGLVVDFGDVAALPGRPADTSDCVTDPGANGVTLLVERFGREGIRVNGSGLVCAIAGYPAEGCGEKVGDKYRFWSYWKGGTGWEYSSVGPSGRKIVDGSVDGWHFVEGSASPADGPPANSPSAGPCSAPLPTAPSTSAPPPSGGGSGGSGGSGSTQPTTTVSTAADPSAPVVPVDTSPDGAADDGASMSTAADGSDGAADSLGASENASDVSGGGGSGLPLAALGVAVLVVALGGGAVLRFRTRADE